MLLSDAIKYLNLYNDSTKILTGMSPINFIPKIHYFESYYILMRFFVSLPANCTHGFPTKWVTHGHESLDGKSDDEPTVQETKHH